MPSFIDDKSDVIHFAPKAYEQKSKGTKEEKCVIGEMSLLSQNRKEFLRSFKDSVSAVYNILLVYCYHVLRSFKL